MMLITTELETLPNFTADYLKGDQDITGQVCTEKADKTQVSLTKSSYLYIDISLFLTCISLPTEYFMSIFPMS